MSSTKDPESGDRMDPAATGDPGSTDADEPVPEVLIRVARFLEIWRPKFATTGPDLPENLYHYTGIDALVGIVSGKELWGTNAAFLNDETEITHAARLLQRVLDNPEDGDPGHSEYRDLADGLIHLVLHQLHNFIEVYVACFCAEPDLLSQWRGYGSTGGGYAIGFGTEKLVSLGGRSLPLIRVVYDEVEQERQIRTLVNGWRIELEGVSLEERWPREIAAALFAQVFALLAISFKSKSFAEEQEWRLAYIRPRFPATLPDENFIVDSRPWNGMAVPFVRFTAGADHDPPIALPITSIRVGPHRYPTVAASGIWHLLTRHGLRDSVKIDYTEAPLRSM